MFPAFLPIDRVDKDAHAGRVEETHGERHSLIEKILPFAGIGIAGKDVLQRGAVIMAAAQVVSLPIRHACQAGIRIQRHEGELGAQRVVGVGIAQHGAHTGDELLALDGLFLPGGEESG